VSRIGGMLAHALQRSKLPRPGIEDVMDEVRSKINKRFRDCKSKSFTSWKTSFGELTNMPQPPGPCR
jgi:hypothetical protein